jgi:SAM-dependent methyltransferase
MGHDMEQDAAWLARRESFDRVAELYDAYRPGYPEAMVDYVVGAAGLTPDARILEIGSGTGKSTDGFARRGYRMLCVEPGARLLAVAQAKLAAYPGVQFENVRFEDWQLERGSFDLVISGQAWHWIPDDVGYAKAAAALKDGGHLALFWNRPVMEPAVRGILDAVFRRCAPQLAKPQPTEDEQREADRRYADRIEASGIFGPVAVRQFGWSQRLTTEQYVGGMRTQSDLQTLPEPSQRCLFAGLSEAVEGLGGYLEQGWRTVLYLAPSESATHQRK